jgi:3-hydroxyacyl-[acyl-carrier-protein] dehydratase
MMLKDDFFRILNVDKFSDKTEYSVQLNSEHSVYQNHFPENPVTPGVCIIQTVKELVAETLACPLFLQKVVRVRYFKAINPLAHAVINISLNVSEKEGAYSVSATVFSEDVIFSQLSLCFRLKC